MSHLIKAVSRIRWETGDHCTVQTFPVVEHLGVIEHVQPGFFTVNIDLALDAFTFEQLKGAFGYCVVEQLPRRLMLPARLCALRTSCQS